MADGELNVVDTGGDGAPIVLAHGVGSSARFIVDAFGPPLAEAGWRVVAFDLRGHGDSGPAPDASHHRLATHAADLAAVAGSYGALAVGGVSLGAHAAVAAAATGRWEPVLACLPAWTGRAVPGEGSHAAVAAAIDRVGIAGMVQGFERDETLEPWLRGVLVRDWRRADEVSLATALGALDGGLAPTEAELRCFPAPLAVVAWPGDPGHPLSVAQDWCSWAPRSALETLDIADLNGDLEALGRAAVAALGSLGGVTRAS